MIDFLKSTMWIRPRIGIACWGCDRAIYDSPLVFLNGLGVAGGVVSCDRERCNRAASEQAHGMAVAILVEWRAEIA